MDILTALVLLAVAAAMVKFVVSPGTARGIDGFAAGFLPYRGPGLPRGVQEEELVPWTWSAGVAEVVEADGAEAPVLAAVDRGSTVRGTARRRP